MCDGIRIPLGAICAGGLEIGADHFVCGFRYSKASEYERAVDVLASKLRPAIADA